MTTLVSLLAFLLIIALVATYNAGKSAGVKQVMDYLDAEADAIRADSL